MYEYQYPEDINDPSRLPSIEVWRETGDSSSYLAEGIENEDGVYEEVELGWYYWFCFPGCLPDSCPVGPFETYNEALTNAREE